MYIGTWAARTPHKPAVIRAETGEMRTYAQVNEESRRIAGMLLSLGIQRGERIAIFMENHLSYMAIIWAALRSGLCAVPVNRYASADDVAYVVNDCGAKALFTTTAQADVAKLLPPLVSACRHLFILDGELPGWNSYDGALHCPPLPQSDEHMGSVMSYTSGTTGRPKGVVRPVLDGPASQLWPGWKETGGLYGFDDTTTYLSPAPFYHGAPMRFCRAANMAGGTIVFMDKFDAEASLMFIERYQVTHSQWVPTMFVRMLRLGDETKARYDLSSHRCAVHAAAPCPISIKRQMIGWWGPFIEEYYGSTDGGGITSITCEEWLAHPGSIGKGDPEVVRICVEGSGDEAVTGQDGLVYLVCKQGLPEYLNDPEKTRLSRHPTHSHWISAGDIGHVGEDGYVYLTDRKAFTIVSGGVNIYPQQIEDALCAHPLVVDAAVFGVPDDEMGEAVKAVVELVAGAAPTPVIAKQLTDHCREHLARYMVPRSVDFIPRIPRTPTGKLMKRELRSPYWEGRHKLAS